jgi:hypothetical protein
MTWNDHDHRGEYAEDRHDHYLDYAEKHHRHYDDESTVQGLREDLGLAEERIRQVEDDLRDALNRIHALEGRLADYAEDRCPETSDGEHTAAWHDGDRCGACGQYGPGTDEESDDDFVQDRHRDLDPNIDEDYDERGQS